MAKLRPKQKRFVQEYTTNGGNATQAVIDAKYKVKDRIVAKSIGAENLTKLAIQNQIKSIVDQIPEELVVRKHLALLEKEEVITKNNNTTGEIEVIPTGQIDAQAVSKGLDMFYKLKGSYAPEKSVSLNLNTVTQETRQQIQTLAEEIINKLRDDED